MIHSVSAVARVRLRGIVTPQDVVTLPVIVLPSAAPTHSAQAGGMIEPLSVRELEVLGLLAQGCADKKIAEKLVIARETVHKHLKNIYGKLEVHNRTEAVVHARELGLV